MRLELFFRVRPSPLDLLRSPVLVCSVGVLLRGCMLHLELSPPPHAMPGALQTFRFYIKNIELILMSLLFHILRSRSARENIWWHWVYAATFFSITNLYGWHSSDSAKQQVLLSHWASWTAYWGTQTHLVKRKENQYTFWSHEEAAVVSHTPRGAEIPGSQQGGCLKSLKVLALSYHLYTSNMQVVSS